MKKFLFIAALFFSINAFANNTSKNQNVSSIILMPWDIQNNHNLFAEIKKSGFNNATFYLNWNDIEAQKGQYKFDHYYKDLDAIVENGLSLILVLDMGGRPYLDHTGKKIHNATTTPQWIYSEYPDSLMQNFSGTSQRQIDFTDLTIKKYSTNFTSKTVEHFSKRYPGKILGFAIGLQEEHEIKYGQTGYQWRDFKKSTQNDFQKKHGALQPVINYNNNIKNSATKKEPLLYTHKEYRENRLKEAACDYAKAIRDQGASAIGYFAETFTSHDAIYATGIVEKLAECLDIAVIDYNFYDGYNLVPDWSVLPLLADYMGSIGYKKVMIGAYAEKWEEKAKTRDLIPIINRTIAESLRQSHVIGFELGGFQRQAAADQSATIDMDKLSSVSTSITRHTPPSNEKNINIGILGSATNFYVWHGERSVGRNIHRDALFESYKLLNAQPGVRARVIGEKNLLGDDPVIEDLDAILIPHQAALPASIKSKLTTYWKNGGVLIQDMRLGEFDENGKATVDWMNDVFGIEKLKWKNKGGVFLIGDEIYRLKPSPRLYTSYASMKPRPGYRLLVPDILTPESGIMVRGERTLVFGFMPQLIEDKTQEAWKKIFVREIMNVAQHSKRKIQSQTPVTSSQPSVGHSAVRGMQ